MRCRHRRRCPTRHSGPRSCAKTHDEFDGCPGSRPTSRRQEVFPAFGPKRTCALLTTKVSACGSPPMSGGDPAPGSAGATTRFIHPARNISADHERSPANGEESGMGDTLSP